MDNKNICGTETKRYICIVTKIKRNGDIKNKIMQDSQDIKLKRNMKYFYKYNKVTTYGADKNGQVIPIFSKINDITHKTWLGKNVTKIFKNNIGKNTQAVTTYDGDIHFISESDEIMSIK